MPETTQIVYSHKELTELMLRDRGITSGHWAIYLTFRLVGANVELKEGDLKPVAMTFVDSIGVTRVPEPNPLSVDAGKVLDKGLDSRKPPTTTHDEPSLQPPEIDQLKRLVKERLPDLRWYPCWGRAYFNSPLQPSLWIDIVVRRRDGTVTVGITTDSGDAASVMDSVYESHLSSKLLADKCNIECITGRKNKSWRRYESALPFKDLQDITELGFVEDAVQLVRDYRAIYDEHIAEKVQG